jgi:hypothetical protein
VNRRCPGGDYVGAIQLLVASGADIHAPGNKYGRTMLQMADGNPQVQEAIQKLL